MQASENFTISGGKEHFVYQATSLVQYQKQKEAFNMENHFTRIGNFNFEELQRIQKSLSKNLKHFWISHSFCNILQFFSRLMRPLNNGNQIPPPHTQTHTFSLNFSDNSRLTKFPEKSIFFRFVTTMLNIQQVVEKLLPNICTLHNSY